jgi:RNA polymerase sigma-70 factor (ECF subfamily)
LKRDEELVEDAVRGSSAAFNELVERYQHKLLRFLVTRCATRADAEDAVQDSFVNAYRYLHTFNPRWRFSTWLYRIALRNIPRPSTAVDVQLETAGDEPDLLRECIVQSERENLWLTARRLLSDDAYAAMWMRYVEDMPINEVARALDRSVSWTKVNLMRGRNRLETALADGAMPAPGGAQYG